MDELERKQLNERIGGTVLRLGWLVGIIVFIPTLFYLLYWTAAVASILYLCALVIVILATCFLILLSENFRSSFNSDHASVLDMAQKAYIAFEVVVPIFFVVGIGIAALSIIISLKANNGRVSRKRLTSSIALAVFLCIGLICYYATKSNVLGAGV